MWFGMMELGIIFECCDWGWQFRLEIGGNEGARPVGRYALPYETNFTDTRRSSDFSWTDGR